MTYPLAVLAPWRLLDKGTPQMLELNAVFSHIKDMQGRVHALRGYL